MSVEAMRTHAGQPPHTQSVRASAPPRTLVDRLRRDPLHTAVTVAIDVAAAALAVAVSLLWGWGSPSQAMVGWLPWLFVPLLIGLLAARGMYRRSLRRNFLDEMGPVQTSVALAVILLLTLMLVVGSAGRPGEVVARLWICAALIVPTARNVRAAAQRALRRRYRAAAPTLIIGGGPISHQIIARTQQLAEYGLHPVGILDAQAPGRAADLDGLALYDVPYLGDPSEFNAAALATQAEELIVAFPDVGDDAVVAAIRVAHGLGMRVWVVPHYFDAVGSRSRIEPIGGLPLLVLPHTNPRGWQFLVKDVMDRGLTGLGLLVISPIFLTLALLVRLSSPGPILFKQKRVGRNGKPFDCYKFRSMRPPRESDAKFELKEGAAPGGVEGVDRRTRIGKIMRQTSLDELPQLLNVLKGDMSLVGPRPERPEFVELFEAQIRRYGERHRVKAGVTGWAQVHGLRGQTSIADRAEWDNYYIENWSLWLDIKILLLTVPAVLKRAED